jgi:hypothetical protein
MGDTTDNPTDSFLDRVLELGRQDAAAPQESNTASGTDASPGRLCPRCGSESGPGWAFCEICGEALSASESLTEEAERSHGPAVRSHDAYHSPEPTPSDPGEPQAMASSDLDAGQGAEQQPRYEADETAALMLPVSAFPDDALSVETAAEPGPKSHRRTLLGRLAIGLAFAIVIAAATVGWIQYNHTQDRLGVTRHQLNDVKHSLAFKEDQLSATRSELSTTQGTLKTTQDDLSKTKADLAKSQGSLSNAQDRLDLQAGQIDTLQTCLHGVSEALSDVAYGAYDAAVSALSAVDSSCRKASSIL